MTQEKQMPTEGNGGQVTETTTTELVQLHCTTPDTAAQISYARVLVEAMQFIGVPPDPATLPEPYASGLRAILEATEKGVHPARACEQAIYAASNGQGDVYWQRIMTEAGLVIQPSELPGSTWEALADSIGPITWLWEPWLVEGMLTMLASDPGIGKSTLCLRIAACFLCGESWPDGSPFEGPLGEVLWCETEAGQALNLERARQWGLPIDRIRTPLDDPLQDISLDNQTHKDAIAKLAHSPQVRLVVVDSLTGAHTKNEKDSGEMFRVVKWLAQLARDTSKPILLTHHLRKRGSQDNSEVSLERVRGSTAIVQATRVVWALDVPDQTQPERKRLHVIKSNLARYPQPIGLTIDDDGVHFGAAPESPRDETMVDKAADLLLALLQAGPIRATQVYEEGKQASFSESAIRRAQKRLGVVARKTGNVWYWALPARESV